MKKKIVIRVRVKCDKCRNKALKTAAGERGVISVSLEGEDKDQVAVTGEGMDAHCLVKALKKKLRVADMVSMEEVKEKKDKEKEKELPIILPHWNHYPPTPVCYDYDQYHGSNCIIM